MKTKEDLKRKVDWLRDAPAGRHVGFKLAAANVAQDLSVASRAKPDCTTIDGRPGATGAALEFVKMA